MRPVDRCQALLPVLAAGDPHVFNRTADGVRNTGARIMRWMAALIAGTDVQERPLHAVLADAWSVSGPGADLLRSAMVLCADHELNASTFTVRCVAATGASPYSAVVSGLAALTGPRHGGLTERAEALLDSLLTAADPIAQATELLRRGDEPCGFGHPLYPAGDPRARCLMDRMVAAMPDNATLDAGLALAEAISEQAGRAPTCDYALALLSRCLGLPAGAGLSVFALGRAAGWIGHALEQYAQNILIRPRARYTGVHP